MKHAIRFASRGFLAVALSACIILSGCTFASAVQKLKEYAPIAVQAFAGVVSIVNPPAGSLLSQLATKIPNAWSDVNLAITNYQNAPTTDKATKLGEVLTAVDAVQNELKDATMNLGGDPNSSGFKAAQASLLLMSVTLAEIETQLAQQAPPEAQAAASPHAVHARANAQALPKTVALAGNQSLTLDPNPHKFKSQYNHVMQASGYAEYRLR